MRPIFTIHAGEYLVGAEIEKRFNKILNVWIPSKDTGVDLLITNKKNEKIAGVQVKFSKSFNETHTKEAFRQGFRTCGWYTLNKKKINDSKADFWVFVVYSFDLGKSDYIIIKPKELFNIFKKLNKKGVIHFYLWTTQDGKAFEARDLTGKDETKTLLAGGFDDTNWDITKYLNKWQNIVN